jgi:hypothetical protein
MWLVSMVLLARHPILWQKLEVTVMRVSFMTTITGKYTNNEAKKKDKDDESNTDGSEEGELSLVQGWSDEGLKLLDNLQQQLVEQHEKDAENDHKMAKHARELIRKHEYSRG